MGLLPMTVAKPLPRQEPADELRQTMAGFVESTVEVGSLPGHCRIVRRGRVLAYERAHQGNLPREKGTTPAFGSGTGGPGAVVSVVTIGGEGAAPVSEPVASRADP
jgi:hypothetical protein